MANDRRSFRRRLLAITAAGLAIRLAYVLLARRNVPVLGDALYYHFGASLLAHGKGFIVPLAYLKGQLLQAADHPPLYLVWIAIPSFLRIDSPVAHMLWSCVIGTGTVAVTGLAGRKIAGPRAGLVAAGLAAVYPNIWSHDGALQSETMAIFTVAVALLLAYRYREQPSLARLAWLGVACGFAALARSELLLLVPLVAIPLVWGTRTIDVRTRLKWLAVSGLATLVVIAPWVTYNMTRFEHPVVLSTGFEVTLLTASCDVTYYGEYTGYWSAYGCSVRTPRHDDQSQRAIAYRHAAFDYISHHKARLPVVVLARWGRITGLYQPGQQVSLDHRVEGRESWVAWSGLLSFYLLALAALYGVVVLRRRKVPVYPLVAPLAIVWFSVTVTFATNRYRASGEVALVLLAAVAIDALLRRLARRRAVAGSTHASSSESSTGVLAGRP
jgi:4-amino-4-deoxy-L-arabinose transferase-like glycosyltransferase